MPPRPPPIDATPHLDERQQEELSSIAMPLRLLGAWLLLIRDDRLGGWEQRLLPCPECVDHRLPCVDPANVEARTRCEGCYLNDLACGQGRTSSELDAGRRPPADPLNKKRKLEAAVAASPWTSSAYARQNTQPSYRVKDQYRAHAHGTPKSRDKRGPTSGSSASSQSLAVPDWPSSLPPRPKALPPPLPDRFRKSPYGPEHIVAILDKARRHSQLSVNVVFNESFGLVDFQAFDYTVIVRPAGALPTWLVIFVDNRRHRGRAMFYDRWQATSWRSDSAQNPVRVNLERAFNICHRVVTLEAEIYPCLDEDQGGSVYAAELAVEFALNGPNVPSNELIVDRESALERHKLLVADYPHA